MLRLFFVFCKDFCRSILECFLLDNFLGNASQFKMVGSGVLVEVQWWVSFTFPLDSSAEVCFFLELV